MIYSPQISIMRTELTFPRYLKDLKRHGYSDGSSFLGEQVALLEEYGCLPPLGEIVLFSPQEVPETQREHSNYTTSNMLHALGLPSMVVNSVLRGGMTLQELLSANNTRLSGLPRLSDNGIQAVRTIVPDPEVDVAEIAPFAQRLSKSPQPLERRGGKILRFVSRQLQGEGALPLRLYPDMLPTASMPSHQAYEFLVWSNHAEKKK
jgi:hypothetical protein